jgi:dihydrofolate reductase
MDIQNPTVGIRTVVGNISLSLDGRVTGPGGEYDMGWIVPHAITDAARDHMVAVTTVATTVLLGRKNYQGFGYYWPKIADDESADPRDRTFSRWLNAVEKIVFSSTVKVPLGRTPALLTWILPQSLKSCNSNMAAILSCSPAAASLGVCFGRTNWTA